MNQTWLYIICITIIPLAATAQGTLTTGSHTSLSVPADNMLATISDSTGILFYEPLNYALGGDSVRNDRRGYAARGWMEDFYPDGKLLHRGYYFNGQLKAYKNYFESGQVERDFKTIDNYRSVLITYWPNGNIKSNVQYQEGYPVLWEDYYSDGKLEYMEEFHKSLEYYLVKKSFYPSGQMESLMELIDTKKLIYASLEYYSNGVVKEEGKLVFNRGIFDYQHFEKWKYYNESAKLVREEIYEEGKVVKETNF